MHILILQFQPYFQANLIFFMPVWEESVFCGYVLQEKDV